MKGNIGLSTELITEISYRKEFKSWRFEGSPFVTPTLWLRTNGRNVCFKLFTVANLRYQLSW